MSSRQSSPYESRVSSRLLTIVVLGLLVLPASAQTFQSLFEFVDYHKDGAVPAEVAPTQGRDGMLYGSTDQGGAYSQGTIFRFDPSTNPHTVLHDLAGSDGLGLPPMLRRRAYGGPDSGPSRIGELCRAALCS